MEVMVPRMLQFSGLHIPAQIKGRLARSKRRSPQIPISREKTEKVCFVDLRIPRPAPGLHFVSTPIGTASDITLRALDILARADLLIAEDTRALKKLMAMHGIDLGTRHVMAYHDHSGPAERARVLEALNAGQVVAYASEAGTPLLADPGFALARDARAGAHGVFAAPGASALLAALVVAGQPTDRFLFAGFAPPKSAARKRFYDEIAQLRATLVFYESPKRLKAALGDMILAFGPDRPASICRELTKKFEEILPGTLEELSSLLAGSPTLKGEIVVVVGPAGDRKISEEDIDGALLTALEEQSLKDAAASVAEALGRPRKELYARALELKQR